MKLVLTTTETPRIDIRDVDAVRHRGIYDPQTGDVLDYRKFPSVLFVDAKRAQYDDLRK